MNNDEGRLHCDVMNLHSLIDLSQQRDSPLLLSALLTRSMMFDFPKLSNRSRVHELARSGRVLSRILAVSWMCAPESLKLNNKWEAFFASWKSNAAELLLNVEYRIKNQLNWKEINEWTVNSAAMFVVIACESRPRRHRASVHHHKTVHKLRVEECSSVYVYKISLRRAAVNMWMQNSRLLQRGVCLHVSQTSTNLKCTTLCCLHSHSLSVSHSNCNFDCDGGCDAVLSCTSCCCCSVYIMLCVDWEIIFR